MANADDSAIIEQMLTVPDVMKAQYFSDNAHLIMDDATYWNVLGTLWKLGGTVYQQELWMPLFCSKRKRRHKIMKSSERKEWRKLPKKMVGYRAVNNAAEIDEAISWSLSRRVVEKLFTENGRRKIAEREFNKNNIIAYFNRRNEEEILVISGCTNELRLLN